MRELYHEINQNFNKRIFALLLEGQSFKPSTGRGQSLGEFQIIKFKKKTVDPVNSKKFRRSIVYLNHHSDGFVVHLKWIKTKANFFNRILWNFSLVRSNKRLNDVSIKNYIFKNGVSNFIER